MSLSRPLVKKARITSEDKEDRISRLPDELIHKILSFVDTELVVQTSVLSKRWELIWMTLPFLKFIWYEKGTPKKLINLEIENRHRCYSKIMDNFVVVAPKLINFTSVADPWGNMTPDQIRAAMDLWKEKYNAEPETRPGDQEERSGESRGSVFDRIAKNLKKPSEDARDEIKRAALRERIRKEEEAKAKKAIEKRIREEEAKLKRKAHRIHVSSDSEP
ncbi:hypothetical protein AgCh_032164 [Apium graveolens]